jgi:glycosyltransferase involved in cell wall biosynthesis
VEEATPLLRKILWRIVLQFADRVISVSRSVEKFTLEKFKIKKEKSVLLLNGIDIENWLKVDMNTLFTHDKIQLASVGRLWEQKGHTYLLQALAKLDFSYELHLFGDGPLRQQLENEAKNLNINDNIFWHGVTPNVVDYMVDVDIVVQASLWEGLSLVVMEMMAAGRPIVTTPSAGDELLQSGQEGLIVPSKDVEKLVEAIKFLAENKKEAIKFATKARLKAKENFGINKNVEGLENIYKAIL